MPEHPAFDLKQIDARSMVQLRVRPSTTGIACTALGLPEQALHWVGGDPAAHSLGPGLWLLASDTKAAGDIIQHIDTGLSGHNYAASDMTSAFTCFKLKGPSARTLLAMGCGLDMHSNAFQSGHCTRTYFAGVLLIIAAVEEDVFNLYVDRSLAQYLCDWIASAGYDPLTHNLNFPNNYRQLS